ncbi:ArsR/SmtB family transcription factor [Roseinatronobacter alkalisoli]|uniref:Metalloregulator ArsR/SmtB family transcription factor n=1 Tax=Roseinatronobacter alkalisoli TaxID=3028235 RepID=A0ABT5T7Z8_9RHOB|nr:metalloregulator ArsR/SmtB family transcription factor [Roseinatronobacter sp. HJB301]MDD7970820.1 metalloregulator ArsR/SmtB family transcription factor [Roseinatronobacter sp. HJB301]
MAKHDSTLDLLFTALGDPTRRAILMRLAQGDASVSELAAPHDMALPSFVKHLGKLEQAGLITTTKAGRVRSCALSPDAFAPMDDWLSAQRAIWNSRLDRFDDYVSNLKRMRENETGPEN